MKKITSLLLAVVAAISLSGCAQGNAPLDEVSSKEEQLTVPDIVGTEEDIAKNVLSSSGFIPIVETEYDDEVEAGKVIRTSPAVGSPIEKNGKVTICISNGPWTVTAKDANIRWYNVTNQKDNWDFQTPYIIEDELYIECYATFMADVKWAGFSSNGDDFGTGFGRASINDTFDKTVPVEVRSVQTIKAGEREFVWLIIPLNDLDVQKPTTMYLQLAAYINGDEVNQKLININFVMSW